MKKLLIGLMLLGSFSSWANDCSILVDYRVSSKWGDSSRRENTVRSQTKNKIEQLLLEKGFNNIKWFNPYSIAEDAKYYLKLRANVEARAGALCGGESKECYDENAQVQLKYGGSILDRGSIRKISKRRFTTLRTDIDYLIDPYDGDNSRTSAILNKRRLDKLLISVLEDLQKCPNL